MIEFIKSYYQYILVGLAVVILLVLTLISIFKKDNKEKKEGIIEKLAKSNKDKAVKETYKSEFVVFKKNLQNYYLYLYNSNGDLIYKSEIYNSLLSLKNDFNLTKELIINDSLITIKYGELIYLKVKDPRNNRFYGSTTPFKEMEVVNKISELKDYFERLTIPSEITANLTEISYNEIDVLKENMKTNTEYKLLKHEDLYYYNLEKEDQVLLSSIPSDNKKDAYKNMKDLVESFRDSNILIDKIKDEYYFSIFDYKTKNIIYYSFSFKSIEEVKAFIELISYNIPKK